jgi:hypothetical protein
MGICLPWGDGAMLGDMNIRDSTITDLSPQGKMKKQQIDRLSKGGKT